MVTHSNKRFHRPAEPEPARQPISVQRYEVLSEQDEDMEEVEPEPRSKGYAMSEARQHQGRGEVSRGEGGRLGVKVE